MYVFDNIKQRLCCNTRSKGVALAAELAIGEGCSKIFIVKPMGQIEDEPNVTD